MKFQVLIGILTILDLSLRIFIIFSFQVLIGILTMRKQSASMEGRRHVSSPYRYSNNYSVHCQGKI